MLTIPRILFLAIALIGGGFWSASYMRQVRYDREVDALVSALDSRLWEPSADPPVVQKHFYQALLVLSDFRDLQRAGDVSGEEVEFLDEALKKVSNNSGEANSILRALRDNLDICERCRIFSTPGNAQAFANGRDATILAGPWEGETLVIQRRLPAHLSREAWNHPANFILVPAPAAAMIHPYTMSDAIRHASTELAGAGIISSGSGAAIKQLYERWLKQRAE